MTSTTDGNSEIENENEIQDDSWDCESHEWEYKKSNKECLICNKCEDYLEDPYETHIHNFSKGLFPDKPKLSVCQLCGHTKYEFESEDVGDEGFFDFTSDYVKSDDKQLIHDTSLHKFKNKLLKVKILKEKEVKIPEVKEYVQILSGKKFLEWQRNNPEKLSFIRKR